MMEEEIPNLSSLLLNLSSSFELLPYRSLWHTYYQSIIMSFKFWSMISRFSPLLDGPIGWSCCFAKSNSILIMVIVIFSYESICPVTLLAA